ncbi:MAG: secretin N-terminal domain-containing protein [Candidatus Omnitrophota bacterium]
MSNTIRIVIILIACVAAVSPFSYAQDKEKLSIEEVLPRASIQDGLSQRMALDLRNMDIVDSLKFLAQKGNINIIASKGVEGRVSLFLKDVSVKDALEIILLANNLAYEVRGDILYVMTEDEYKLVHGGNFKDKRQVKMFKLKYAKPDAAFKALEMIKSDIGKVVVDEDSGSIILMDTPERLKIMYATLRDLDQIGLTKVFPLQYAKAKDVVTALSTRLDAKKTGTIQADERNNQVIVSALPERMQEIEKLIKSMDKKTKQVLLEAKVLKIILSDDYDMGVDWQKIAEGASKGGLTFAGAYPFPSDKTNYFKIGAGHALTGKSNYSVIIKLLEEFGETRNLSSPSIAVIDGQEAKIMVGTSQAYVTTTIETGGTTATTAAQVQFIDVGVQLYVTPSINDDGYVTMKIRPEVSTVDDHLNYQIAPDVTNTVPIVAKTTAETTIMVKDGETIIIGGLRKDEKIKTVDKFPLLGDIPLLGAAFRSVNEKLEKQEIVVFITPRLLTGDVNVVDVGVSPKGLRKYE